MNYIGYIWLKIRLLFIRMRVNTAKKHMLSGIQSSRHTTGNIDRSYRQFLDLSSRQEELAVAIRRITHKNTDFPMLNVKIDTGNVCVSPEAKKLLTDFDKDMALIRHRNGDWGETSIPKWRSNNEAVSFGMGKLRSRYPCRSGGFFFIETDLCIPKTVIKLGSECI